MVNFGRINTMHWEKSKCIAMERMETYSISSVILLTEKCSAQLVNLPVEKFNVSVFVPMALKCRKKDLFSLS